MVEQVAHMAAPMVAGRLRSESKCSDRIALGATRVKGRAYVLSQPEEHPKGML